MSRKAIGSVFLLLVVWMTTPLAAQTASPLKAIPGDAAVIVKIKGLQASLDKIAALADSVQPGSGNTVKFSGALIGGMIKNPTMDGVDLAGDFYVAVFMDKENPQPGVVFAIPSKNLADMKESLGEEVTFIEVGKHGVYTDDEDLGDAVKEQLKSKEEDSIADGIDDDSLAAMNRGDISVFVNVPALLETYQDELDLAKGQIENIKDQRPDNAAPGINWEVMMGKLQGMAEKMVQAIEDHDGITVSLSFTKTDVVLEKFLKIAEDSETSKYLKDETGGSMPLLAGLPADSLGYYGVQCDMSRMMEWGAEWASAVVQDEKALEALSAVMKETKGIQFNGLAGSFQLASGKSGALRAVNVFGVSDAQKLRALAKKYAESIKDIEANGVKTTVTHKLDAEKIGTNSIDLTTSKITVTDDAPNAEQQRKMLSFMYGEEGTTARTVYLKDRMIQTIGGGKAAMEAMLAASPSRTTQLPASVQAIKSKLGTKPNFVGLIDLANLALQGMKIAQEAAGDEIPVDLEAAVKGISLKPSYVGVGVEVRKTSVGMKTVIPAEQIKGIVQIVMGVQKAQAGAGAN